MMIESVHKDVKCVFGILKAHWSCLDKRFKYRTTKFCRDIFVTCAVLHNMMLSKMGDCTGGKATLSSMWKASC